VFATNSVSWFPVVFRSPPLLLPLDRRAFAVTRDVGPTTQCLFGLTFDGFVPTEDVICRLVCGTRAYSPRCVQRAFDGFTSLVFDFRDIPLFAGETIRFDLLTSCGRGPLTFFDPWLQFRGPS
jgi:hypothetical protein